MTETLVKTQMSNAQLRWRLMAANVNVFLASMVSDVLVPKGMPDRLLSVRNISDEENEVAVIEMPITDGQSDVLSHLLTNVPDHLIAYDKNEGAFIVSVAVRKLDQDETNEILAALNSEWKLGFNSYSSKSIRVEG